MVEDRALEVDQLLPGVEAQLLLQGPPGLTQRGQRIGLATGAVERQGEQVPAGLAQGLSRDQRRGIGHDVPTGGGPFGEERLLGAEPQLVQPAGLGATVRPPVEVGQCSAAPQREGLAEHGGRPVVLAGSGQLSGPCDQRLEPADVDLVVGEGQPVAAACRLHRVAAERPAKPRHAPLHHLRPRGRRVLAPQGVGELLGREHVAGSDDQRGQHHAIARGQSLVAVDLQRP